MSNTQPLEYERVAQIHSEKNYDCYINLCDGLVEDDNPEPEGAGVEVAKALESLNLPFTEPLAGVEVTKALEDLNLPFTGTRSDFYVVSKKEMKEKALEIGIPTPRYFFNYGEPVTEETISGMSFPLIVKHHNGGGSVGMSRKSKTERLLDLSHEVQRIVARSKGVMVEEFITGREFTVLVMENPDDSSEPILFEPIECVFGDGEEFKHYDLKWNDYHKIYWVQCKPEERELTERLKEHTKKIFVALNGSGYGRCDFRVNMDGEIFFLEINPLCGVFYPPGEFGSADMIISNDAMGHPGFLRHLLRCAFKHYHKNRS